MSRTLAAGRNHVPPSEPQGEGLRERFHDASPLLSLCLVFLRIRVVDCLPPYVTSNAH